MLVVEASRFGDPDVLAARQVPDPAAGPGQVVVRAAAAAGRIRPVIGQTFPLERAADAHAAIEGRSAIAKTLLLT